MSRPDVPVGLKQGRYHRWGKGYIPPSSVSAPPDHRQSAEWDRVALGAFVASMSEDAPGGHVAVTTAARAWPSTEDAATYAVTIGDFVEKALWQSRIEIGLTVTTRRLAQVQEKVVSLQNAYDAMEARLAALETATGVDLSAEPIPWEAVAEAIEGSAEDLGWVVTIETEHAESRVEVRLGRDMEEELVNNSLAFYAGIAARLGSEVVSGVRFDLDLRDEE